MRLGGVECAVGGRDYFFPGIDIFAQSGDSNADGHVPQRLRLAEGIFSFCHSLAHAFSDYSRLAKRSLRQQDATLLAAIATGNVRGAQRRLQRMGRDFQGDVTRLVPVAIVVSFEVVDVDHQATHGVVVSC